MTTVSINALDLYFTSRVEEKFQALKQYSTLKKLDLWNFPQIKAEELSWGILPRINSLVVYKITPAIAAGIVKIGSVKKLKLAFDEPLAEETLKLLTGLRTLETLHVHTLKMEGVALIVNSLTQLSSLRMYGVTPEILNQLARLPKLKSLHLFALQNPIAHSFKLLTGLQKLDISNCTSLAPTALQTLTHLPLLRLFKASLVYTENKPGVKEGPSNLYHVAGCLTQLEILNLDRNKACEDADLVSLTRLTSLRGLNLSYNSHLTANGLIVLTTLTALRVLNIYGCHPKLTPETVKPLLAKLPNLVELNVNEELQKTDWWKKEVFPKLLEERVKSYEAKRTLSPTPFPSLVNLSVESILTQPLPFSKRETLTADVRELTFYPIEKIKKYVFY